MNRKLDRAGTQQSLLWAAEISAEALPRVFLQAKWFGARQAHVIKPSPPWLLESAAFVFDALVSSAAPFGSLPFCK